MQKHDGIIKSNYQAIDKYVINCQQKISHNLIIKALKLSKGNLQHMVVMVLADFNYYWTKVAQENLVLDTAIPVLKENDNLIEHNF